MASVCLAMIVRDESRVIRRCLDSVRPLVSCWSIVDTGSVDDTREVVREHLRDLPGELHERPWVDFGTNRSEALALARPRADYALMIDADEVLVTEPGFRMPELVCDSYSVWTRFGSLEYARKQLFKNSLGWRFVGLRHEYPAAEGARTEDTLRGIHNHPHQDGARSSNPRKYLEDAEVLSAAIANEPRNERHWFYLGQSYADAGLADEAIAAYERRVELGGWEEETYVALLRLARAKESAGRSFAEVVEAYVRAHERRPTRAEAVTDLARYARCQGAHALAHMAASAAIAISRPSADVLFVESDVYRWRALDEYSLACHHTGRDEEAVRAMNRLLESGSLTPDSHARVLTNHRFARGTSTRWRVVVLEPSGYLHVRGLDPVARLVDGALRELGLDSRIASRPEPMSRSIVFGAHVLPERASLPADAVLFNLEQIDVDSPWLTAGYRDLLRRHPVWDYHPRNVDRLRAFGVENVWEVPLGYGPSLAIAGDAIGEPRVDVLLFGSLNERRERVLADLSARGLVVEHAFGVYGEELDRRIARAKVVLNLRFYANGLFEIVRVLPLLARGVCVVTEDAPGDPVLEPLRDGLVVAPYDGLAEACAGLARASTAARDSLGARARHAARARSMVAAVRRAVVAMGVPIPPPDAARDAEADPR